MRDQIKLCLTSDLLEESKILWTYMLACKSAGAGIQTLSKQLGFDVGIAMEVLEERKMVEKATLHNGGTVWRVVKFVIKSNSTTTGELQTVSDSVNNFIKIYQRLRKASLGRELFMNNDRLRNMKKIVTWMDNNSVPVVAFMKFSIEKGEWLRDQMPFPTPQWLAGSWIRQQWDDAKSSNMTSSSAISPKHAGKEYHEADQDVASILASSGLDMEKIDESKLRYIESSAAACVEIGEMVGIDPSVAEYVKVIYEHKRRQL